MYITYIESQSTQIEHARLVNTDQTPNKSKFWSLQMCL